MEGNGGEESVEDCDTVLTALRDRNIGQVAGHGCWCWWVKPSSSSGGASCLGVELEWVRGGDGAFFVLNPAVASSLSDTVI